MHEEVCEKKRDEEAEEICRRGHCWKKVFHAGGGTPLQGLQPMEHPCWSRDTAERMKLTEEPPLEQRSSRKTF